MTQEHEAQLLAAMINAPAAIVHANRVDPDAFCVPVHVQLYRAISDVAQNHDTVTQLLVHRELARVGEERAIESLRALNGVTPTMSPSCDLRALSESHRDRLMRQACLQAADCYSKGEAEEGRAKIISALEGVGVELDAIKVYSPRELIAIANAEEADDGLRVTAPIIRRAIRRLSPGSMLVIGGQTNAGKSTFAFYLAQMFDAAGSTPGIISLEDPEATWGERCEYQLKDDAVASRIRFVCRNRYGMRLVIEAMWTLVKRHGAEVLVVDYLQLMNRGDMRGVSRAVELSAIARDLKSEAKRLGVPLILVSQISRQEKAQRWKEPTMFDLKETGDLENFAESIVLVWKTGDEQDSRVLGKVAKVKNHPGRPRFELLRSATGELLDPVEFSRQEAAVDTRWAY